MRTIDNLIGAVKSKTVDVKEIESCLEEGVDVNGIDPAGWSPLDWLVQRKETENTIKALEMLLRAGTDLTYKNNRQKGRYKPALEFILDKKKHQFFVKILQVLQEKMKGDSSLYDYEIAGTPLLFYVIECGCLKSFQKLLEIQKSSCLEKKYKGQSPFIFAIRYNINIAFYLLKHGANSCDKDSNNRTALQYFILHCEDIEKIQKFFENFNFEKDDLTDELDSQGSNCLHMIACAGELRFLKWLLQDKGYKFDFNVKNDSGDTPLHRSVAKLISPDLLEDIWKHEQVIITLLDHNASVYIQNNEGHTVLDLVEFADDGYDSDDDSEVWKFKPFKKMIKAHAELEKHKIEFEKLATVIEITEQLTDIKYFIRLKILENLYKDMDLDQDFKQALSKLHKILDTIRKKKILRYTHLQFYELIKGLIQEDNDYKLRIHDRFQEKYLKPDHNPNHFCYTFLDNKVYRLADISNQNQIQKEQVFKLITTLVYEAQRHPWESPICKLHVRLIGKIKSQYCDYTLKQFQTEIQRIEEEEKDYFGENISDNSDNEDEKRYQDLPHRQKAIKSSYASLLFKRSQPDNLFTQEGELRQNAKKEDRDSRQHIIHDDLDPQIKRDLDLLNNLAIIGELNEETIKTIHTNFFIADYRGITYRSNDYNKLTRSVHRKLREEGGALFSRAVLSMAGYTSFPDYFNSVHKDKQKLEQLAMCLQDQLLQLASSGPVRIHLSNHKGQDYLFDNALLALQDFYTKSYSGFHKLLENFYKTFINNHEEKLDEGISSLKYAIIFSIQNQLNPFVSTSDTPEHALRYAYGEKYYKNFKDYRLQPRWRKSGLAERPYAGKVYIILNDPLSVFNKSNHLVSLNQSGKVHIPIEIITERETTFLAYIPQNKVIGHQVAKFPSFDTEYQEIFFEKYGLDQNMYKKFQKEIKNTAPHSKSRESVTKLLLDHLVSYTEVCLIEEARVAAQSKEGVLIYRNSFGGFSLLPCKPKEISHSNDRKRKEVADANHSQLQEKRKGRKENTEEIKGFLVDLLDKFDILPSGIIQIPLLTALSSLIHVSYSELKKQYDAFEPISSRLHFFKRKKPGFIRGQFSKDYKFLEMIANKYKITIILHTPELDDKYARIAGTRSPEKEINLYYLGGDKYAALQPKTGMQDAKEELSELSSDSSHRSAYSRS